MEQNNEKKQKNKEGIETLEEETINLDSGVEAFKKETAKTKLNNEPAQKEETKLEYKPTLEDKWQDFYNNLSFVKKQKEAQKIQNQSLYAALQTDTERSEKPVTYKYTAIDSSGKKVTGVFYAYSKMEVYTYLTNEGNTVLTIETNKYIELSTFPWM